MTCGRCEGTMSGEQVANKLEALAEKCEGSGDATDRAGGIIHLINGGILKLYTIPG